MTSHYELFKKLEELRMGVFEMRKLREIVEIAKMRMHHLHHDYWVQRNVNFVCLRVLIPKFDQSMQSQPLLIPFLCRQHSLIHSLPLLLRQFELYNHIVYLFASRPLRKILIPYPKHSTSYFASLSFIFTWQIIFSCFFVSPAKLIMFIWQKFTTLKC